MILAGTWLVLATLAVMLILFGAGWWWAQSNGQFDDVEAAKYAMLENERKHNDVEP